jgi:hypothetical protein
MKKFTHLDTVRIRGALLHFHGYSQVTGDALYKGYTNKGEELHAIVTNPHAHDNQAAYFNRGG